MSELFEHKKPAWDDYQAGLKKPGDTYFRAYSPLSPAQSA